MINCLLGEEVKVNGIPYQLADMIKDTSPNHSKFKRKRRLCRKYPKESLAGEYCEKMKNNDKTAEGVKADILLFYDIVRSRYNQSGMFENSALLHLRLGDVLNYNINSSSFDYNNVKNVLPASVDSIIITSGLHATHDSFATCCVLNDVKFQFIKWGYKVNILWNKPADYIVSLATHVQHFIPSNGGFTSLLTYLAHLSNAKIYTHNGTLLNEELLNSMLISEKIRDEKKSNPVDRLSTLLRVHNSKVMGKEASRENSDQFPIRI